MAKGKRLEEGSEYAMYDVDGDGTVSDEELAMSERMQNLSVMHEKADAQRNMCWLALLGMLLYPSLVVFCDLLGLNKAAELLEAMSSIYFVSVGGLVSVWFGSVAYTNTKNNGGSK
tara:strand:+ start:13067 stop:13414 length:348 start_codon:yes stop_codon:yes gene_type:complete